MTRLNMKSTRLSGSGKRLHKLSVLSVALGFGMILVAGCGTTGGVQANGSAGTGSSAGATAAGKGTGTLVIYEAEGYAKPVAAAFTKKTGIKVKLVHLATGSLAAKIQAEGNYPHWDLAWFDDAGTMQALDNQGLLNTGWAPNGLSNYTSLGQSLVPKDDAYFPTGVSSAAVIAYNTKLLSAAQAPKDWSDLLKPQYKGQIAMNDPSISGPTYPFVAGIMQEKGLGQGEQFFSDLKANGLQVYPKNGPTIQAMLTGKAKIALVQDAAITGFEVKGNPVKFVYPSSGAFVLPGDISIAKKAGNKSAAEQFVQFCLTSEAQAIMVNPKLSGSDAYHTPLVSGVSPNSHVHTQNVKWVVVDPVQAARNRTSVLTWFSNHIVH